MISFFPILGGFVYRCGSHHAVQLLCVTWTADLQGMQQTSTLIWFQISHLWRKITFRYLTNVCFFVQNMYFTGQVLSGWLPLLPVWLQLWPHLIALFETRPEIPVSWEASVGVSPRLQFTPRGRKQLGGGKTCRVLPSPHSFYFHYEQYHVLVKFLIS